jgi:hypothetical protein
MLLFCKFWDCLLLLVALFVLLDLFQDLCMDVPEGVVMSQAVSHWSTSWYPVGTSKFYLSLGYCSAYIPWESIGYLFNTLAGFAR